MHIPAAEMGLPGRQTLTPDQLWSASQKLSPRIRQLHQQFWSFYRREYTNQVRDYTTGTSSDTVYSIWRWTYVPEVALFLRGYRSYPTIDADTLQQARKYPTEYRNLLVRVTGYNAYLTGLGKEIQAGIIARESHRV